MNRMRVDSWEAPLIAKKKSPLLEELSCTLDRLEARIHKVRESYRLSLLEPRKQQSSLTVRSFGARLFGRKQTENSHSVVNRLNHQVKDTTTSRNTENKSPSVTPEGIRNARRVRSDKDPVADFISFQSEDIVDDGYDPQTTVDAFIEDLRRVAELCIIGENFVANLDKRRLEAFRRQQEKWAQARDVLVPSEAEETEREIDESEGEDKMQLFDLFFEKNGLEMVVNLLSGKTFQFSESEKAEIRGDDVRVDSSLDTGQLSDSPSTPKRESYLVDSTNGTTESLDVDAPDHPCNKTMLPPLSIAIQALQSISILIQNVSRATSLYVILSNNHVNGLIDLPLNLYKIAEQRRQILFKEDKQIPAEYISQSITEMTTHFVTFLKSLAMRMNAETLQFFLKYPMEIERAKVALTRTQIPATRPRSKRTMKRSKSSDGNDRLFEEKFGRGVNRTATSPAISVQRGINHDSKCANTHGIWRNQDFSIPITRNKYDDSSLGDHRNYESDLIAVSSQQHTQENEDANLIEEFSDLTYDYLKKVEFPLYDRALEFCSPVQENFVRLTAMNICLNTLRLTTVVENKDHSTSGAHILSASSPEKAISPVGVLHNSEALPVRERLVIAQFTCIPSRVERLIAPIFSKLAERWNTLEEYIRNIDAYKHMGILGSECGDASGTIAKQKLVRDFKDKVADLEDDLLMLDDVFKVGLTVLNEQTIEIMLATFVYPLLLQPLLIYSREYKSLIDESRFSFSDHPFGRICVDLSDVNKKLLSVSGPAKAALFTIACVFHSQSNRPLLRLLYTVLIHPLSPDSTSAPTIRGMQEVTSLDLEGRRCIRLDGVDVRRCSDLDDRSTYSFGRLTKQQTKSAIDADVSGEACVFVLAPALAEVLEFPLSPGSVTTPYGPNPYRRAFLGCLSVSDYMAHMRELCACTLDAVVSALDGTLSSGILFGIGVPRKDAATTKPNNVATSANETYSEPDSRPSTSENEAFSHPFSRESICHDDVITALIDSIVFASRVASSDWKIGYDDVAVHALLCAIRHNHVAISNASCLIEQRTRQASKVLGAIPNSGLMRMGGTNTHVPGSPSVNDPDFEEQMFAFFLDYVFFEAVDPHGRPIAEEIIVQLQTTSDDLCISDFFTKISNSSNTETLTRRISVVLFDGAIDSDKDLSPFEESLTRERRDMAVAFIKLDTLSSFLKNLVRLDRKTFLDSPMSGIAFDHDGSVVLTSIEGYPMEVLSSLSLQMTRTLFSIGDVNGHVPVPLSTINLFSLEMLPCVCEAPASSMHLFSDDVTGVVAEGVTWQSLYVVFYGEYLVLAQPVHGQVGVIGRVISSCGLARLCVQQDPAPVLQGGPARRLLLSHKAVDCIPPPLFLFETISKTLEGKSHVVRLQNYVSRLDIWFEHQRAADYAFNAITKHVFEAKVQRGTRLRSFLT